MSLIRSAGLRMGRGAGAAPRRRGTRPGGSAGQAMSNWPSLTPATNAAHSTGVKLSTGPSGSLESRRSTPEVTNPTSTQAGLAAPEKELLRNAGNPEGSWLDTIIGSSFLVRRRHGAGDEIKIRPLTWADSLMANRVRAWEGTWAAAWGPAWAGPFTRPRRRM